MLLLRRITFYLFLIAYVVACPLTILYAFGYKVRPRGEQYFQQSGLIYVNTNPPGASVYVGSRRYTRKTPTMLPGLLPGEYPVKLVLKNYRTWEQRVPVEGEKATALDKILLLPTQLKPEVVEPKSFENLTPVPGSRFFLLTTGQRVQDLSIYDWRDGKISPLLSEVSPLKEAQIASLTVVRDSAFLLLRVESQGAERWLWVEPRRGESTVEDLTNLFLERPASVEWEPRHRRYLFALQHGDVNRLDTELNALSPKWIEGIRGFGLAGRAMYVLQPDGWLLRMDRDGRNAEPLKELPLGNNPVFGQKESFHIKVFAPEAIFLLGDKGQLLTNRSPYQLVEKGVLGIEWDAHHQRALLWQKDRLGIVELGLQEPEADEPEPHAQLRWVYQQGRDITRALWAYDGSHVVFQDEDQLSLLELETYGAPRVEPLVEVKRHSTFSYEDEAGTVYYLDRTSGQLVSLKLLPRRELLPLPLLERKEKRRADEEKRGS